MRHRIMTAFDPLWSLEQRVKSPDAGKPITDNTFVPGLVRSPDEALR